MKEVRNYGLNYHKLGVLLLWIPPRVDGWFEKVSQTLEMVFYPISKHPEVG